MKNSLCVAFVLFVFSSYFNIVFSQSCFSPWNSSTQYGPGTSCGGGSPFQVSYNGRNYTARYCNSNSVPDANSCCSWSNWIDAGVCSACNVVNPGSIGSTQSIPTNTAPSALTNTSAASGGNNVSYTYQWQISTNNSTWTDIAGANSTSYTPGVLITNTYFRRKVTSAGCGDGYTSSVLVSIITNVDSDNDGVLDAVDLDDDNDGILDAQECPSSNFQWSGIPTVSGNSATGTIGNVNYTYNSSAPVATTPNIFGHGTFPSSYAIPNTTSIQNTVISSNTLTFNRPIKDPVLVFASIGNVSQIVPIRFGAPIDLLWSTAVTQISSTEINGQEGFAIVRLNGTFSQVSFDYLANEGYVNFYFGVDFTNNCDTDSDGLINSLDLDSDGDYCPDAIEGGATFSYIELTAERLSGSVDANGVPLVATASGQSVGTSANASIQEAICSVPCSLDSDLDGLCDDNDLDDDNDGILDCVENGFDQVSLSQVFNIAGNASYQSASEIRLTPNVTNQAGSAMSFGEIDFRKNFNFNIEVFLGTNDGGADGMAVVFHNDPNGINTVGAYGIGLGASGIQNGIAIEFDTWQNVSEVPDDHTHLKLTNSWTDLNAPFLLPNIENGQWHLVNIVWNANSKTLSYSFDGNLVSNYTNDLVANVFNNDSKVHIGFTAGTGSASNEHKIRFPDSFCSYPIIKDTDGDGFVNSLDLDSDGDGCVDAIEGGASFTSANLTNNRLSGTVDANGVPTIAGATGQNIGASQDLTVQDALCSIGLPIELLSFSAVYDATSKNVLLKWTNSSENNIDYYTIERSSNGKEWQVLSTKQGQGYSSKALLYETMDNNPLPGISYYRLKQTNFNGIEKYTSAVAVYVNDNTYKYSIYPNPASTIFSIVPNVNIRYVQVLNSIGVPLITSVDATGISVSELPSGVYLIAIHQETSAVVIKKIVVK